MRIARSSNPSPATLLNLANCLEKLGRAATAWATYREAASLASATGRTDYVASADRHAEALAPKLAHLVVHVPTAIVGLVLRRDGAIVERAEWGSPIPIDAGSHTFVATAAGYQPWTTTVDVGQDGLEIALTVPPLEPLARPETPPSARGARLEPTPMVVSARAADPGSRGATHRTVGLIVGGLGIVAIGVATGFAIVAKNKRHRVAQKLP